MKPAVVVIVVIFCSGVLHAQAAKARSSNREMREVECKNRVDHGRDPVEAAANSATGDEVDALRRCATLLIADTIYLDKIMDLMFMHGAAASLAVLSPTKGSNIPEGADASRTAESLKEDNSELQAQVESLKKELELVSSDNEVLKSRFNDMKTEYKSTLEMVGKMQEAIGKNDASTCGNSPE